MEENSKQKEMRHRASGYQLPSSQGQAGGRVEYAKHRILRIEPSKTTRVQIDDSGFYTVASPGIKQQWYWCTTRVSMCYDSARQSVLDRAPRPSPTAPARQAGDDDVEERHNAGDDCLQDAANTVHNGHQHRSDGAENRLTLFVSHCFWSIPLTHAGDDGAHDDGGV